MAAVLLVIVVSMRPVMAEDGWANWTLQPVPVFGGQYVASDPALLRDGDIYRMFYSCYLPDTPITPAAICQATSADGIAWENVPVSGTVEGLMLSGREGDWDENLETSFVIKRNGEYLLYYTGYQIKGEPATGFPASIGVARSTDGITFSRVQDEPILSPTPHGFDSAALYSPAILEVNGELVMIYTGHCYEECNFGEGIRLMSAISTDGLTWTKQNETLLGPQAGLSWTEDGVAEPALVQAPDGMFYLFFTGIEGDGRVIGIARSESPFGPWEVDADPVIVPTYLGFDDAGVLAPYVEIDGTRARMWLRVVSPEGGIAIGYAEAEWPLPAS